MKSQTDVIRQIDAALTQFSRTIQVSITPVVLQAQAAMVRFGTAWMNMLEGEYLQHHRNLPGSPRTARLRKKRRDALHRWFETRTNSADCTPVQ